MRREFRQITSMAVCFPSHDSSLYTASTVLELTDSRAETLLTPEADTRLTQRHPKFLFYWRSTSRLSYTNSYQLCAGYAPGSQFTCEPLVQSVSRLCRLTASSKALSLLRRRLLPSVPVEPDRFEMRREISLSTNRGNQIYVLKFRNRKILM